MRTWAEIHRDYVAALPPFTEEGRCAKCGSGELDTRYLPLLRRSPSGSGVMGECLERTCLRCGYSWPEKALTDDG